MSPTPPAHARLLLELAVGEIEPDAVKRCRALVDGGEVDWAAFVDTAARQKLLPLVGKHIAGHRLDRSTEYEDAQAIPYGWLYSSAYLGNRQRNLALADECGQVLRALHEHGLRHAVRKGFVVAEQAYHDPAARRINDLDLVGLPADTARVDEVLRGLGYVPGRLATDGDRIEPRPPEPGVPAEPAEPPPYLKPGHRLDVPFLRVDVSHGISAGAVSAAQLLDRARPTVVCGVRALALSPEDHLLDLSANLRQEAAKRTSVRDGVVVPLSKLLDIALTAASCTEPDWRRFVDLVRGCGAQESVCYGLHVTDRLHRGAVPAFVLDALCPADPGFLDEADVLQRIFTPDGGWP